MANDLTHPTEPHHLPVSVPLHIAIIMDGNGRWAKKRFLPRTAGHHAGVKSVKKTVKACINQGVKALTLFAFSSENWRRPQEEVSILLKLFITTLEKEVRSLHKEEIRIRIIGDTSVFPLALRHKIEEVEQLTCDNKRFDLVVAANYGGRWDVVQAARKMAECAINGEIQLSDITDEHLQANLSLPDLPHPDLFIRTGGECRISNFLLWHLAYTELYFTSTLWPDFDATSLDAALLDFSKRQRRFGHTSEQITQIKSHA
ncbi:MAG: polyprenyl diphosphate synthase [Methylococcales bacterium]